MNKKKQIEGLVFSAAGIVVMFVIIVMVNVIAEFYKKRLDLTAEKAYTLSDGTKSILQKLDTPVKIRFYFTRNEGSVPMVLVNYARYVEDLLSEYKQNSRGKIIIEKLDPQPDSDAEDSANLDGVQGEQLTPGGERVYFGVAISCVDSKEAIPFLHPDRERFLEYDLSRAITQVVTPAKPVVGVMSALPVFGSAMDPMMMMRMGQQAQQQRPWVFINELKHTFTVKQVEMNADKIDEDIKVLVVVHPAGISDTTQFALDQFILRGGRVIAFLDPMSYVEGRSSQQNPMQRAAAGGGGSSLDKLIKAWGIEFDTSKVVADKVFMSQVGGGRNGGSTPAPAVLSMTAEGVSTNDVAASQIDSLMMAWSGVFTGTPVAGLKQEVILKTTDKSQLVEKMMAEFAGEEMVKNFAASGKQYSLAIRLSGKFKTAFPDGKPPEKKDPMQPPDAPKPDGPKGDSLKESKTDGFVVLLGDSDMLFDAFCVQIQPVFGQQIMIPMNKNLDLLQNLIEQMAGDSDLINLRGRAVLRHPFTVVKRKQEQAEENYRSKIRGLQESLQETQRKMSELQASKDKNQRTILSPEQQKTVADFRKKEAEVKKQLKQVQKDLRKDIDSLENRVKWANIGVMPGLVILFGVTIAIVKLNRTAAR